MPSRRSTRSRTRSTTRSPGSSRPRAATTVQPPPSRPSGRRTRPKPGQRAAAFVNNVVDNCRGGNARSPTARSWSRRRRDVEPVESDMSIETPVANRDERSLPVEKSPELRLVRNVRETLATPIRSNLTLAAPTLAQPQIAAAAAPQPQIDVPPVISAIGTADLQPDLVRRERDRGTAQGPAGQRRHGRAFDADDRRPGSARGLVLPGHIRPRSDTPPERIIYLQHGFGARGVFYDYTASYLANRPTASSSRRR